MSTTLLDTSAGSTAGDSDGFRVALINGGPIGVSIRATTPAGGITAIPQKLELVITGSNFTDGPTTAANINTQLAGAGTVTVPIEADTAANAVRYTELASTFSGPVMYGFLRTREALSNDLTIEVEALEL